MKKNTNDQQRLDPDQVPSQVREDYSVELRRAIAYLVKALIPELPTERTLFGLVCTALPLDSRIALVEFILSRVSVPSQLREELVAALAVGRRLGRVVYDRFVAAEPGEFEGDLFASTEEIAGFARTLRSRLNAQVRALPAKSATLDGFLPRIRELQTVFGLDDDAAKLLAFVYAMEKANGLDDLLGNPSESGYISLAAELLDVDRREVARLLGETSLLVKFGFIDLQSLSEPVYATSHDLESFLEGLNEQGALQDCVEIDAGATYRVETFPITAEARTILTGLLAERCSGSVVLYGAPGAGKTELVRSLARAVNKTAHFVRFPDDPAKLNSSAMRIAVIQRAAMLASARGALLVIDEADDLLNTEYIFADGNKGPLIELIDSLPVTTVWISNSSAALHPAVVRRIAYSLQFAVADIDLRLGRLTRELKQRGISIAADERRRLARTYTVSLGSISKATEHAARLANGSQSVETERLLEGLLRSEHVLLHNEEPRDPQYAGSIASAHRQRYLPELINASTEPHALLANLERFLESREAGTANPVNVLFHGLSGSGKTAFAEHLAHELGLPLHRFTGSDLLSAGVGETEKLIAEMFVSGESEDSVIFLDEAENLLQDRGRARFGWERQHVNEFLTQLERHSSIFICATNELAIMDRALLRRFTFKVEFFALRAHDRVSAYRSYFKRPGERLTGALQSRVADLHGLTVGHLRTVFDQVRLARAETVSHPWIIDALEREIGFQKEGGARHVIGFRAS